jgi:hypothetical protein
MPSVSQEASLRKFLIAAASVAAIAGPAAAQEQSVPQAAPVAPAQPQRDPRDEAIVRSLPDQREIEAMGDRAVDVVDALMKVPVGPLREAIEGRKLSRREREETLGDVAGKDDPYFRERMRDQMAVASVAVGVLAQQMAVMAPVLRQTLEDATRRIEDAARGMPPRDYDRPGPN